MIEAVIKNKEGLREWDRLLPGDGWAMVVWEAFYYKVT